MSGGDEQRDFDILVAGAGAAGLKAAHDLIKAGYRVAIVEARSRIGGRVFTSQAGSEADLVELGAEFLHGFHQEIVDLLENPRDLIKASDKRHMIVKGGRQLQADFFAQALPILENMPDEFPDRSFESYLESIKESYSPLQIEMARSFVEGFNAANSKKISLQSLVKDWRGGADSGQGDNFRFRSGYQRIFDSLIQSVQSSTSQCLLNHVIKEVNWSFGNVQVICQASTSEDLHLSGRALILTVPLGVLKANHGDPGSIKFVPDLGQEKAAAISALEMGPVYRLNFLLKKAVWSELGEDLHFLHAPEKNFHVWWPYFPERAPVLVAWAGGRAAEGLLHLSREQLIDHALSELAEHLGREKATLAENVLDVYFHDWQSDPFSRGAYSYNTVGSLGVRDKLSEPLKQTLFFAGEATVFNGPDGTVHGAFASGKRAAEEVIQSLHQKPS